MRDKEEEMKDGHSCIWSRAKFISVCIMHIYASSESAFFIASRQRYSGVSRQQCGSPLSARVDTGILVVALALLVATIHPLLPSGVLDAIVHAIVYENKRKRE